MCFLSVKHSSTYLTRFSTLLFTELIPLSTRLQWKLRDRRCFVPSPTLLTVQEFSLYKYTKLDKVCLTYNTENFRELINGKRYHERNFQFCFCFSTLSYSQCFHPIIIVVCCSRQVSMNLFKSFERWEKGLNKIKSDSKNSKISQSVKNIQVEHCVSLNFFLQFSGARA